MKGMQTALLAQALGPGNPGAPAQNNSEWQEVGPPSCCVADPQQYASMKCTNTDTLSRRHAIQLPVPHFAFDFVGVSLSKAQTQCNRRECTTVMSETHAAVILSLAKHILTVAHSDVRGKGVCAAARAPRCALLYGKATQLMGPHTRLQEAVGGQRGCSRSEALHQIGQAYYS